MPKSRELRLARAINELSQYYGQFVNRDISRFLATRQPRGTSATAPNQSATFPRTYTEEDILLGDLINLIIDVSEGSYFLRDIVNEIVRILELDSASSSEQAQSLRSRFTNYLTILSDVPNSPKIPTKNIYSNIQKSLLTSHGDTSAAAANINNGQAAPTEGQRASQGEQQREPIKLIESFAGRINSNPSDPNKLTPNIGVILSHTSQLSIHNRFTNASSLFINGIPGIEMSRAMPYLDVQMIAARPATLNDQLFAPSIYRFLLGAESAPENSILYQLQSANSSSNLSDLNGNYTVMGMEAFLSPQTLATTNKNDTSKRSTQVYDQFRPLMSINDFSVEIVQSFAAYAYRTARLSLTLHDRGRMSEVAELFRPDLLFGTQFLIEYGWIHPDGELNDNENAYADILNGMRTKEKFRVTNWNFNLTDTGEVKVDLELVTVGDSSFESDLVVEDGINVGNTARLIGQLVERIGELRRNIFERNNRSNSRSNENSTSSPRREIRGIEFLDTISNAFNNIRLNSEQRQQMTEFMQYLSNAQGIPNVSQLRNTIVELYGQNGTRNQGVAGQVRNSVEEQMRAKLQTLKKDNDDPFLVQETFSIRTNQTGRVNQYAAQPADGNVSLANLLLNFVGLSLASTGQYDEIQMIFYPFNNCAGYASRLNIGNFRVDLAFFKRKYTDYILSNLSRSGKMTVQQFWQFLITNILDDHGARSYGLFDYTGGLWRDPNPSPRGNQQQEEETSETERYDVPSLSAKLSCLLRNVTPDGEFRMPQISYYLEAVPARTLTNNGENEEAYRQKTILRMHVYDQATDTRGGLSQMLMSERNNALAIIPSIPQNSTSEDYPASANNARQYQNIIAAARDRNLVEGLGATNSTPLPDRIRWRGGAREIKDFLYDVMPSIIYATNGTTIKTATVTSLQDQAATSINIVNAPGRNGEAVEPNGEESGGLPLQVIPVEASITTYGCPLITHGAQYFVDFGTGTSIDQIYQVNGISHKVGNGEFATTVKLVPVDGYGTYRNYVNQLRDAARALNEIESARTEQGANESGVQQANERINQTDENMCDRVLRDRSGQISENQQNRGGGGGGAGAPGGGFGGGSGGSEGGGGSTSFGSATNDPLLAEIPPQNELGRIKGPQGEIQITRDDLLWLARSIMYEGGSIGATIWTYAQRLQMGNHGSTLTEVVRTHSQPVNPRWARGGSFCPNQTEGQAANSTTNYTNRSRGCSSARLNRRDRAINQSWNGIPDSIRRAVIAFAQGRLGNDWPGVVDFAAVSHMTGDAERRRLRTDERFRQGGQVYLTSQASRSWSQNTVTVQYNGPVRQFTSPQTTNPAQTTAIQTGLGGPNTSTANQSAASAPNDTPNSTPTPRQT